ncbi:MULTISPECIES: hypothetical protein [Flavobacterium]|nr:MULTISPECIES: hypothetical protein [Flavobacterium]
MQTLINKHYLNLMEHIFTQNIKQVLQSHFGDLAEDVFNNSYLIRYINLKTRSANKGSKSRGSFHPLAVLYVLIEDYILKGFDINDSYKDYDGATFTAIKSRATELPFCKKIQNHSFNNRVNSEFEKFFKEEIELIPVIRNLETKKYWINENLLRVKEQNIAKAVIEIINSYFAAKQEAFMSFIKACEELQKFEEDKTKNIEDFIIGLLAPNVDARLFEIVSYSILKFHYHNQNIIWGFEMDNLTTESLQLYKTGRTNANDGGIDFVMKPLGRFFQVTETIDFKKYFLDIDKIQKYPISFVIKSEESTENLLQKIKDNANKTYSIKSIVEKYMSCIEEVINIQTLRERFNIANQQGYLKPILDEIILQSKVEFNYDDSDTDDDEE